ncbi:4-amino-4-deoxy-L-arabinose transferase-like glycosyltransferase [Labedella gwakjiensis]|uniref:4-amino-4-deoxy-L-arabinose transferase-like glycosyltransferase n=1 Tax=Labedella gwakjiensis TaxID=390269 RepID=A0A2P8GTH9_9MICO|nr:glycosyltransferase family 39 protein [Labedella gwakjiensis]PSL37255.1 4-amino-4-deoxy-L-arabinose transferase-like glycosyltransferase [Labedella gwakjiensis]RUQ84585.1 phospholipid carrier-dependent glycosyltransferase [Labedella gwakjiensis]
MTSTLDRPGTDRNPRPAAGSPSSRLPGPVDDSAGDGGSGRGWNPIASAGGFLRHHARTLAWLLPTVLVSAVIQLINMGGSPQRIDDEGTYTAQAWSIGAFGELTHYTYWYDHPPVGWIQIAAYTGLTGAFDRYDVAVLAAREAMVFFTLVAVVLVWFLARRLSFSRPAATVASLIFALSPLAVQFHRSVYLDNIATVWLLAAILLAMSRRNQLAAFAGSALAFGIAVLSKETYLLALPLLAFLMWRTASKATRRYTLTVASSVLVLVGGSYLALALVKGEVAPGSNRVSLFDGIAFQLSSRESSGSVFDPESLINRTLGMWWQLDPAFIIAGVAAAVAALFVRKLRPFAILVLALTAFMFRPGGYLPVPYIIMLIPFAALLVAGVTDRAIRTWKRSGRGGRIGRTAWIAIATAAVVAIVPLWTTQLRGFLLADLDQPMRQAEQWVETNVQRDSTLVVDDAMWVDLVRAGFDREDVIWYYKVDTDPAVAETLPNGWQDVDYVITTDSMRTFPTAFPQVSETIANSVVVASFGEGSTQVDVRKVDPNGLEQAEADAQASIDARAAAGSALAQNPNVTLTGESRSLLEAGMVDSRIILALAEHAVTSEVTVADFPISEGEGDAVRRQVLVSSVDGEPTTTTAGADEATRWLSNLSGVTAARSVSTVDGGVLATFSIDEPAGLISGVTG